MTDLSLPPLLTSRPVVPPQDPFASALEALRMDATEAGDLFWSVRDDRLDYALVLAPEVGPQQARHMIFVAMVAAADALGAIAPPELAITWDWPLGLFANRGRVGKVRLAMSETLDGDGAPEWLVLGQSLALKPESVRSAEDTDPGLRPEITSLWDEGAVDLETAPLLESLSRHFLTWLNRWEGEGLRALMDAWLFRCDLYRKPVRFETEDGVVEGTMLGLDDGGNLIVETAEGTRMVALDVALTREDAAAAWPAVAPSTGPHEVA
ncbi:biotin/lipoate--protein ligase family protein [Roseibium aestuarii]|uniref:biotin--[biotin carboxyl-carrier protein] ligase n=1 Tax=Roseibium aestuarii TaxID=2600299 RepID=A0ABW4JSD7_9HYPH|nr:biotin/lipoate--protein ligase family protein [Roseibium aestuarii]